MITTYPETQEVLTMREVSFINSRDGSAADVVEFITKKVAPTEFYDERGIMRLSFEGLEASYLKEREENFADLKCGVMKFNGGDRIAGLTGYNASAPFFAYDQDTNEQFVVIGVRMEKADDEHNSKVEYFRAASSRSVEWHHIDDATLPEILGQDPSNTYIDGKLFLNVVKTQRIEATSTTKTHTIWRTAFYRGDDYRHLELFSYGPWGMKDVTPLELPDHKKLVFTRPQHEDPEKGGLGQIGAIIIEDIEELKNPDTLQNAPLIETRFLVHQWGGIKQAWNLKNGNVGVLGHIAEFVRDDPEFADDVDKPKKYATFTAEYNLLTRKLENAKLIAMADEVKHGDGSKVKPKTKYLENVAFGTALTDPDEDGVVMLIVGIGDSVTGYKIMKDPFDGLRIETAAVLSMAA